MYEILSREDIEIFVGNRKENIPKWLIKSLVNKTRYYDTGSVQDIQENYSILRKKSYIPFRVLFWVMKQLYNSTKNDAEFREFRRLESMYEKRRMELVGERKLSLKTNVFNLGSIYGVYLRNFQQMENPLFGACKFDIVDNTGDAMEGVYVYDYFLTKNLIRVPRFEISKREAAYNAMKAPDNTLFSLVFNALDPDKIITRYGKMKAADIYPEFEYHASERRGYSLNIVNVKIDDGGRKVDPIIPYIGT